MIRLAYALQALNALAYGLWLAHAGTRGITVALVLLVLPLLAQTAISLIAGNTLFACCSILCTITNLAILSASVADKASYDFVLVVFILPSTLVIYTIGGIVSACTETRKPGGDGRG